MKGTDPINNLLEEEEFEEALTLAYNLRKDYMAKDDLKSISSLDDFITDSLISLELSKSLVDYTDAVFQKGEEYIKRGYFIHGLHVFFGINYPLFTNRTEEIKNLFNTYLEEFNTDPLALYRKLIDEDIEPKPSQEGALSEFSKLVLETVPLEMSERSIYDLYFANNEIALKKIKKIKGVLGLD